MQHSFRIFRYKYSLHYNCAYHHADTTHCTFDLYLFLSSGQPDLKKLAIPPSKTILNEIRNDQYHWNHKIEKMLYKCHTVNMVLSFFI